MLTSLKILSLENSTPSALMCPPAVLLQALSIHSCCSAQVLGCLQKKTHGKVGEPFPPLKEKIPSQKEDMNTEVRSLHYNSNDKVS